jgi:RNA polymerase sigma-70 factor (ECF subfamily)
MDAQEKRAFIASIAARHDRAVRQFLQARLKSAAVDVPDLMQEVFLRMLRVSHPETIRTPEAYLFTVAKAVLHQHRVRQSAVPEAVDIMDVLNELEHQEEVGPEAQLQAQQRLDNLERSLAQLPNKAYVTLMLNRVAGMPLEEVGRRLGISRPMAKKYLARALAHCRQRSEET